MVQLYFRVSLMWYSSLLGCHPCDIPYSRLSLMWYSSILWCHPCDIPYSRLSLMWYSSISGCHPCDIPYYKLSPMWYSSISGCHSCDIGKNLVTQVIQKLSRKWYRWECHPNDTPCVTQVRFFRHGAQIMRPYGTLAICYCCFSHFKCRVQNFLPPHCKEPFK